MKSVYERTNLIITEFDTEDVISTSGVQPSEPPSKFEVENAYGAFGTFGEAPSSWF